MTEVEDIGSLESVCTFFSLAGNGGERGKSGAEWLEPAVEGPGECLPFGRSG